MRRPVAVLTLLATLLAVLSAVPSGPASAAPAPGSPAGSMLTDLSNVDGGIRVTWKRYGSSRLFDHYEVITSADRAQRVDRVVRTYADLDQTSAVVPPTVSATPASGAFTFVKVRVVRRDGERGSSATKWIMTTPPAPPASGPRVDLATFNTMLWARGQTGARSWKQRLPRIKRRVLRARPGVLLLQEVSGAPKAYGGPRNRTWQYESMARAMRGHYRLTERGLYRHRGRVRGSQGSRIMYDARQYTKVDAGHVAQVGVPVRKNRWLAWARLRQRSTGATFYVISTHMRTDKDRAGSTRNWRIRNRQAQQVVSLARRFATGGDPVYLGGDLNSTNAYLPTNGAPRTLVAAGFYDGFATLQQSGAQYPTSRPVGAPLRVGAYRRDYLFSYNAPAGSYRFVNHAHEARRAVESDHFMQQATFPLR